MVHAQKPKMNDTIEQYAVDYKAFSRSYKGTDLIFDSYLEKSLKMATHEKRGKGSRRRVTETG